MSTSADNFLSNENNTSTSNHEQDKEKSNNFSAKAEKRSHDNSGWYIYFASVFIPIKMGVIFHVNLASKYFVHRKFEQFLNKIRK